MKWIHPLTAGLAQPPDVIGGKASGLVLLNQLGLPVPPGFVISTEACRHFLRHNEVPDELPARMAEHLQELGDRPVSVRSGAAESMPGMMDTILNVSAERIVPRSWRCSVPGTRHGRGLTVS